MSGLIVGAASLIVMAFTPTQVVSFQVVGEIATKWRSLGAATGPLGVATSDEAAAADGGRISAFKNGFITWHPKYGAHATWGLIGAKWNTLGRDAGLGFPITDEADAAAGGRFSDFSNNATINWKPSTGAHAVVGLIRARWIATGREAGVCGYPTSDEVAVTGGRRSNFEHGMISWITGTRAAVSQCTGAPPKVVTPAKAAPPK